MNQRSLRIFVGLAIVFYILFNLVFGVNILYSLIYSLGLGLAGMIISDSSLSLIERQRIIVLFIVAFFVIFFWACFEQAGSSLTFIADKQTDTRIFGWNMPPSMVQNFNSLFVIIFAVLFSWLWTFLAKRNMEPLSPVKQGIGLLLLAFGFWLIALQVRDLGTGAKIGVIWLILMYLFHTLGELCLSPIGLSLVSKLSPQRFSSLLMGVWFLSNASGYALAGSLGALLPPTGDKYEEASKAGIDLKAVLDGAITPTAEQLATLDQLKIATSYPKFAGFTIDSLYDFFMLFVIFPGAAGVVLLLLSPLLKKMMHGVR